MIRHLHNAFLMWREARLWRQFMASSAGSLREHQLRLKWRKVARELRSRGVHHAR